MTNKKADNLRLGLFVVAGTLVLIVGLYLLGSKQDLFRRTVEVQAYFNGVGGLRPGNNVRYAGINVGTVRAIRIVSDTAVLVTMGIREQDAAYIMDNAIASLGSDGLMGNKLVNIGPGEGTGTPVAPGAVLRTSIPLDTDLMMRTLDRTNVNMAAITDDLRELSDRINRPGSLVYLLSDTVLAGQVRGALDELQRSAAHVRAATSNVDALLADVREGRGALGMLVSDPAAEQQVRTWLVTMQQLADTLASASARVDRFTAGLESPGGLVHTLAHDTTVANDLRRTMDNIGRSSAIFEENLRALQRNWLFRKYFREQERERGKQLKHDGRLR
jgi:phospholipid/cholesterol/gamma-HCH transport system substrate-binding protein